MKLKQIATSLTFFAILNLAQARPVQFQFPKEVDYKETKTGGGVAHYNSKGDVLFSIGVTAMDSNTTLCYPLNQLNTSTNFSYFTNCALVQVYFSVHSSIPINQMLYSITTDKDSIPQWKKLDGRFVKQNEPSGDYRTNIFLDPIPCRNKVFTVKLYSVTDPEVILTQIVSTVPIEKPLLFGKLTGYHTIDSIEINGARVAKKTQEQKNLETAHLTASDMQEFETGDLFLNTDNSPYVYSVLLIRTRKGHTDTLPIQFLWAELDSNMIKASSLFNFEKKLLYTKTYMASIPVDFIREPGTYELLVVPAFLKSSRFKTFYAGEKASIKFEVHPSRYIDIFYVILYSLLALLIAFLFFIWYKRKQKRRIQQQQQLTKEAKLKLEAVRSQLNPHFIFNALAGIQNLMNKNEIEKADKYLTSFSRITRSVLDNSARESITVDEEIKWLTDYLEMEQLRFRFQYIITVDKELDKDNVEIPSMLLQPFVENAIKHGISSMKEDGRIAISFQKVNNDVEVSIKDNGKGYEAAKEYTGAGLPLSKSRVALINSIYKNNPAQLSIDSTANGTKVIIALKNWL
jgi:two-component system, LytTR family, sensor kinase